MSIPSIGAVPTPSGFQAQSAEGNVLLTWSPTPLATLFYISRGTDGTNFTELATTQLLQYLDASNSSKITCVADSGGSLAGAYFLMDTQDGHAYAFWLKVSGVGTAPVVSGYTAVETDISNNATAVTIAASLATTIAAQDGIDSSTAAQGIVTTVDTYGEQAIIPVDGVAPTGFTFLITVLNEIYYYEIQAGNGTYASPASTAQQGLTLLTGQTTVGNIRFLAQSETDKIHSNFLTPSEWNAHINNSYKELYDILIQKFGDDYEVAKPFSIVTTGQVDPTFGSQVFPLPSDFYKLMLCEVALNPSDPNSWVTLRTFMRIQQNLFNYPNVYTMYGITNLRYRVTGRYLQIVPITSANQTIRIWYAPKPNQLLLDTQIVEGVSGWEEYVVVDAAIKAQGKEESSTDDLFKRKAALLKRIEEAAANRNIAEPETVSDSKHRNFAWSEGGYGDNGGT